MYDKIHKVRGEHMAQDLISALHRCGYAISITGGWSYHDKFAEDVRTSPKKN